MIRPSVCMFVCLFVVWLAEQNRHKKSKHQDEMSAERRRGEKERVKERLRGNDTERA